MIKKLILVVMLACWGGQLAFGQQAKAVKLPSDNFSPSLIYSTAFFNGSGILTSPMFLNPGLPAVQTGPVPRIYSFSALSPFCKLDVKLDQWAPLNVRFRLGEVEYVDRLEKKGPTRVDYRR